MLVNICGADVKSNEMQRVGEYFTNNILATEGNVFVGFVYDESFGKKVEVTIIASGFPIASNKQRKNFRKRKEDEKYLQINENRLITNGDNCSTDISKVPAIGRGLRILK